MPKLSAAIRAARRGGGRRIGFGLPTASTTPLARGLIVATLGRVDNAAAAALLTDDLANSTAIKTHVADRPDENGALIGVEPSNLSAAQIQTAEAAGADFIVYRTDHTTADAMLSTKLDYVLRLPDDAATSIGETDLRALASLRPALVIAASANDPLPLADLLNLRKLGMFIGAPLAVGIDPTASAALLEALRESGVAVLLLSDGTTSDDVAALQETIQSLPEKSRRRDDDQDVLVPGVAPSDDGDDDDFDDE